MLVLSHYNDATLKFMTGGFTGLFSMFGAYQKWCRTTSMRAKYYELTLEACGMIDDPDIPKAGKHRELEKADIAKSEQAVQDTISAIKSFTDPFSVPDKEQLYCLASGAPVAKDIEVDVLQAEARGRQAKEKFIRDRFMSGHSEEMFFDPIPKLRLKTMEHANKSVKLTASQGKVC